MRGGEGMSPPRKGLLFPSRSQILFGNVLVGRNSIAAVGNGASVYLQTPSRAMELPGQVRSKMEFWNEKKRG